MLESVLCPFVSSGGPAPVELPRFWSGAGLLTLRAHVALARDWKAQREDSCHAPRGAYVKCLAPGWRLLLVPALLWRDYCSSILAPRHQQRFSVGARRHTRVTGAGGGPAAHRRPCNNQRVALHSPGTGDRGPAHHTPQHHRPTRRRLQHPARAPQLAPRHPTRILARRCRATLAQHART